MAGGRCRFDATASQEKGQSEANEAKRRLSVLGEAQLVVARAGEQVAQVDISRRCALVAQVGDLRIREQVGAHAGLLGTLSGIEERDLRHRLFTRNPGMRREPKIAGWHRILKTGSTSCHGS